MSLVCSRTGKRKMKRQTLGPSSTRNSKSRFGGIKQGEDERNDEHSMYQLPGIPLTPSNQNMNRGVTFVLEKASLVPAFVGRVNIFMIAPGSSLASPFPVLMILSCCFSYFLRNNLWLFNPITASGVLTLFIMIYLIFSLFRHTRF